MSESALPNVVTLSERKAREALRRLCAAQAIAAELAAFAKARGGRFLLFGSGATGAMTERSDIDVMIDVAEPDERDAWSLLEDLARIHDIPADIHSVRTTRPDFLARIAPTAKVLG